MANERKWSASTPGEGERIEYLGNTMVIKIGGEHTDDVFAIGEYTAGPANKSPLHTHKRLTECGYLIEGEVDYYMDGEVIHATPGTAIVIPPGVVHAFHNASEHPARLVTFALPAGEERYFREFAQLLQAEKPDRAAIEENWRQQDIEIIGVWERG